MDPLTVLWAALAGAEGLGPLGLAALVRAHGGAAGLADAARAGRLVPSDELGVRVDRERVLRSLRAATSDPGLAKARADLRAWRATGDVVLHPESPAYPDLLTRIDDPPPLLFVRGRLPDSATGPFDEARTVAIVGTRRASRWGEDFATRLARDLAAAGVVVVSGLALGIDGAAHRGALEAADGRTVAVLGSSFDRLHPPAHVPLARRVAGRGALLSEHPPGTSAHPGFFPRRNRIVSGLARGVVVIEAPRKSGTRITTRFALEQGRTVFCVPSRPDVANGRGILALLQDGATPIGSAEDVLQGLGWRHDGASAGPATGAPAAGTLDRHVLDLLHRSGGGGIEDLAPSGASTGGVLAALTRLELEGLIRADGEGGWRPA